MNFFSILYLIGGLAFFLFGMHIMSESLEKMAGGKLEQSLQKVTSNPIISILIGAAITIAVQSSSATTVMMVGLVNSGIISFGQTIYVIYGSNIGTTLTAWLLSLMGIESDNFILMMMKPENFSPIFALVGVFLIMLSKNEKRRSVGSVLVGFAILMYGMKFMSDSVSPLRDMPEFSELMVKFSNPLVLLLIATVFTSVIQSSAASVGILQALSMTGAVTNGMAMPIVMGLNIGTCATALISGIGTERKAKRVGVLHIMIKIIGTVLCMIPLVICEYLFDIDYLSQPSNPVTVALFHTIFNIITTVLFMPFSQKLVILTERLLPDKKGEAKKSESSSPVFLDERILRSPSVAINELSDISKRMCRLSENIILDAMWLAKHYDKSNADGILAKEDEIDIYEDRLGTYLVKLSTQAVSKKDSRIISKMLHTIGDFERLGDHAVNLQKTATEMYTKQISFSPSAQEELDVLINAVMEICSITTKAYIDNDLELAGKVEPLEQVIDHLTNKIKTKHIERLRQGDCTIELGFVLSDLLTNYERISDHCSNIAVAIIEAETDSFDTHAYLNGVKYGNSEFNAIYDSFAKRYEIS